MIEYPKIETVFVRDPQTHRVDLTQFRSPEFDYLATCEWFWTEKVDGTNIRVWWDGARITFGGRTERAQIPTHLLARLQELFASAGRFREVFDEDSQVCLYGEGYGAKIQKAGGNYKSDGCDFVLFDVRVGDWWLQREDVADVAEKLGLDLIPHIGSGTLWQMSEVVSDGFLSQWGAFPAEGIVARPAVQLFSRKGQRIICKLKGKDF